MSETTNPLGAGTGTAAGQMSGPRPAPAAPNHTATLTEAHNQAKAQFEQIQKAKGQLSKVKAQLAPLLEKGDTVTAEDVIQSAGTLVGQGFSPQTLAGLLSEMPKGGQALNAWLAQQAQGIAQNETKLTEVGEAARHSLGVSALHLLTAKSMEPSNGA